MMVLGNASSRVYTLRCYHATRYIWHHTEHTLLGLEPYPNPLQHTSIAVTLQRYAATAAADIYLRYTLDIRSLDLDV